MTTNPETSQALEPVEVTLKPCPFCGGPGQLASGGPGCHFVRCEGCTASTDDGSRARAITAWNRRDSTTLLQEARDALDFAVDEYECTHGKPRGFYASTHWTHHAREVLAKLDAVLGSSKP